MNTLKIYEAISGRTGYLQDEKLFTAIVEKLISRAIFPKWETESVWQARVMDIKCIRLVEQKELRKQLYLPENHPLFHTLFSYSPIDHCWKSFVPSQQAYV